VILTRLVAHDFVLKVVTIIGSFAVFFFGNHRRDGVVATMVEGHPGFMRLYPQKYVILGIYCFSVVNSDHFRKYLKCDIGYLSLRALI
jgi:hypothetical protein